MLSFLLLIYFTYLITQHRYYSDMSVSFGKTVSKILKVVGGDVHISK